ncbi:MAG: SRPBCC family protein [Candidatus Acidiferrales bacterium]
MAKLAFEFVINAPVDRVAAFFVPQRMIYWYGPEMKAEFEVQGGAPNFALGQKVRITGRVGGNVELTAVITAFEPQRLLEWRFHDAYGIRGMQRWELTAEANVTRLKMRDEYEPAGWLGRLFDSLFTRHAVARRDRAWLANLKKLAERA